jgi:hypothetical protein
MNLESRLSRLELEARRDAPDDRIDALVYDHLAGSEAEGPEPRLMLVRRRGAWLPAPSTIDEADVVPWPKVYAGFDPRELTDPQA